MDRYWSVDVMARPEGAIGKFEPRPLYHIAAPNREAAQMEALAQTRREGFEPGYTYAVFLEPEA